MPRPLIIALVAVAIAAAATGAAFVFGTPQSPPAPAADGVQSGGSGSMPISGDVIADGELPAPDPESPFTFQIPGCRCHSDDPAIVEEHAVYRLNQCSGCHRGR